MAIMYAIIACGVFQKEIERLKEEMGLDFPFEAHYLDPGLHVDFDDLKKALKDELERCREKGYEGVIVAFGQCHPKIDEILKPYRASLIDCQNCVDAFITRKGLEEKAKQGLYFYLSPGWLEAWKQIFRRMNWDQNEARLQMGPFKGVVFVDTLHDVSERELELLEFFDYTNLPFEVMPADMNHFRSLIIKAKDELED
jgi:hypothetical protein